MKALTSVFIIICALLLGVSSAQTANAGPSEISSSKAAIQNTGPDRGTSSLSGTWKLSWINKEGSQKEATMQLKQDGFKLSGSVHAELGTFSLNGALQTNQVTITVKVPMHKVSFTGTIDGDKMSGTTGQGKPWSAIRQ